jgi:hypothetical protein
VLDPALDAVEPLLAQADRADAMARASATVAKIRFIAS